MDDFDDDDGDGYYSRRVPAVISRRRVDSSDSEGEGNARANPFMNPGLLGEAPPSDTFGGSLWEDEDPAELSRSFPVSSGTRQPPHSAPAGIGSGIGLATGASSSSSSSAKNVRHVRLSDPMPVEVGRPDAGVGRSNSPSIEDRNRPLNVRRLSTPMQRVEDKGRKRIEGLAIEEEDEEQVEKRCGEAQPDDFDCMAESTLFSEIPDDCLMAEASVPTHSPSDRISFSRVSFNRESFAERASFDRVSLKRISHQKIIDPHSAHWAEYEDRNSFGDTTTDQVLGSIFEIEGDVAAAFFDADIPVEVVHQPGDVPDSFAAIVAAAAASARPRLAQASNGPSSSAASSSRPGGDGALGALATREQKDGITPNVDSIAGRRSRDGAAMSCDLPLLSVLEEKVEAPFFEPPPRQVSAPLSGSSSSGASALSGDAFPGPNGASGASSAAPSGSGPRPDRTESFDAAAEDRSTRGSASDPARKNVSLSAKMRASGLGGTGLGVGAVASPSPPFGAATDPFGLGGRSVWNSSPAGDLGFGLAGAGSSSRTGGLSAFGLAANERRTTGQLPVRRMALDEDVAPPILVPSRSDHSRAHPRTTAASCAQKFTGGALGFAEPPPPRGAPEAEGASEKPPPPLRPDGKPTAPAVPVLDSMLQSRGSTTALDVVRMAQRRVTF